MTEEDRDNSNFSGFLEESSKFSIILKYPFLVTKYLAIKFRKSGKGMHRAFSIQSSYRRWTSSEANTQWSVPRFEKEFV